MQHWVPVFLEQLALDGNASRACRAAGIGSTAAYALKREDADFAESWRLAIEDAGDAIVAEARRRAVDGVEEPIVYQGSLSYEVERDDNGKPLMEAYDTGEVKDGNPVKGYRSKLLMRDGRPVPLTVNKRSDALLALLVKGFKKTMFGDRVELTGADGAPVQVDETSRAARIAQIMALARERKEADDFKDIA